MNATFQSYGDKSSAKRGFGRAFKDLAAQAEQFVVQEDGKWGFFKSEDGSAIPSAGTVKDALAALGAAQDDDYAEGEALQQFEEEQDRETHPDAPEHQADAPAADTELAAAIEAGIKEGEFEHHDEGAPETPCALGAFAFAQLTAPSNSTTETEPEASKDASTGLKIEKNRAESNGVKRPSKGTICDQVWEIAAELSASGTVAKLSDVVKTAEEKGINKFTARTQYARWRAFNGYTGRV